MRKFIILTFAFSWLLTVTVALQVHKVIPTILPFGVSWLAGLIPGIVAIVLHRSRKKFLSDSFKKAIDLKALALIVILTFGFLAVVYLIHLAIGKPIKLQANYSFLALQLIVWFILAAGEELGWRGFALPKLMEKYSLFQSSLILGGIWCIWHYPKIIGSPYIKDWRQVGLAMTTFSLQIMAGNFIICWLFSKFNRNVWVTTIYHTLWNVVCTIYLFMAMDNYATILIVIIALLLIVVDKETFHKMPAKDGNGL